LPDAPPPNYCHSQGVKQTHLPIKEKRKMMGPQQQTTVAEQQAGGALRRIVMVVAVAALMALVMAASAMPAMAKNFKLSDGGAPLFSGDTTGENGGANVIHSSKGSCVSHDSGEYSVRCT
jgi:hypothetical protein